MKHSVQVWVLLAMLATGGWALAAGISLTNRTVVQRDFRIYDYFRGSSQLKALLRGAEAEYLVHPIPIKLMSIETYTEVGRTDLVAHAETCYADRTNRTAGSAGPVQLRLAEGRFLLAGVGFLWTQTNTTFVVSNQVRSLLRGDLLNNELSL